MNAERVFYFLDEAKYLGISLGSQLVGRPYRLIHDTIRDFRRGYTDIEFLETARRANGDISSTDIEQVHRQQDFYLGVIMTIDLSCGMMHSPLLNVAWAEEVNRVQMTPDDLIRQQLQTEARMNLTRWGFNRN